MSKLSCIFGTTTEDLIDYLNSIKDNCFAVSDNSSSISNEVIVKSIKKTRTKQKIIRNVPKVK